MSFGGSVLAMIITLKNNARHRRKAFEYSDEKNRFIRTHLELKYKTVSVERLARIKKQIRKELDQEDRQSLFRTMAIWGLISILLVGATSYYYFQMKERNAALYAKQKLQRENVRQDVIALRQNDVDYFLTKGKQYLESEDYYYAQSYIPTPIKSTPKTMRH